MSLFISNAWAGAAPTAGGLGGGLETLLFPLVIILIFYFMLIRPQSKRAKEHRKMLEGLAKGDEVVTNGGVLGRVVEVGEAFVSLEIADGIQVKVQRQAVAALMPKGTIKGA
ncbi:MAG: preprotein translocase subunit YajC [Gammaproteobacteria bacterium]|nr:preprotein translocase subunit YajC [Gammaproteobacteria bacterium]